MPASKRVLVTGAGGFIGKNIVELLRGKFEVIAPKRLELDLLDAEKVADYFQESHFDAVVHAAGTGVSRAQTGGPQVFKDNSEMFLNLAAQHKAFDRLINLGSGAEYDKSRALIKITEDRFGESQPKDDYGRAKYFISEQIKDNPGMLSLRCFGVFGKYEDYVTRFVSNSICRALAKLPIILGQNRLFDYIYVNDLVKIISYFIEHEPKEKFYNACRGQGVELIYLAELVKAATGSNLEIQIKRPGLGPEYSGGNSLLLQELGDFNFTPFEQAISAMVKWYKENWASVDKNNLDFDA